MCSLCEIDCISIIELNNYIKAKHLADFNCEHCDFQTSSKIILPKHINIMHREPADQTSDIHNCNVCDKQFYAIWNLNNHIKIIHGSYPEKSVLKKQKNLPPRLLVCPPMYHK